MQDNYFREIPHNWDISKFGDLAKITCGIAATPEYVDATVGVPFLSARNVQNGRLDLKYFQYIPIELHKKLTKNTKPQKGDILLTRVGAGIGDAAVVNIDFDFSIYVSLTLIKCGKKLDSEFVTLLLRTSYYRYLATRDQFAGGGVQNLNVQMVKEYPIIVPPLAEQQKIAQILSTWDKAIAVTEQLLANSQQQKKALMQQLLTGKKRLLEENGVRFEGEWRKQRLGSLLKEGKERNKDNSISRVLSVTNHSGFVLPENQFSKRIASDEVSHYKVVRKGQYGYNPSRINVGSFARLDQFSEGLLSPMYVVFSIDSVELDSDFFLYWMQSNEAQQRINNSTQGSVRDSVGFDAICSFLFKMPSLEEQKKISAVISASLQEIKLLETKLDYLQQEKKALMQQLLTGKRRVKIAV